jgi:hypothetical protein
MEQLGAHRRKVEFEDRCAVERGAGLEIECGATKAVYHAGAEEKGVAEYKGLPAARELDRIFAERVGEEIAGMPADNRILESGVLRSVGGGRSRALRRQARSRVTVATGQRADHADERVSVAKIEKRRFQFGERLGKAFEPIPRRAPLGGRERPLKRRIRIDVAGPSIDIAYQETAKPRFDAYRQPVAVLIVKHLVRLRPVDPGCQGGGK